MKKLSVITICYNIKDSIEKTCKSIVNQTYKDFEWIVVDGGSNDGTLDILNKYKDKIDVLISEPDNGVYNAMNKGLKIANGEYVNFMNGGDTYYNNKVLQKVFKNKTYKSDILYGWQYFEKFKKFRKFKNKIDKKYLAKFALGHQATFYKKDCFNKFGFYDEKFKIAADHEKNVCFYINKCNFQYLNYPIAWFACDGISSAGRKQLFIKEWNTIYNRYYNDDEVLKNGRKYCKPYFVKPIVSLTSFPARINVVNKTIETLLNQSLKPSKIILWLGIDKFPNKEKDLPKELLELKNNNPTFEIEWCNDIRSYTKLIPTLKKYPNDVVITVDDDILYETDRLELLVKAYIKNPSYIHCHRAHRVLFDKKKNILPYNKWCSKVKNVKPSFNNFLTGVGTVLYPPYCFYKDILKEDIFKKLAPQADDIWFWAMAVLNDIKINVIKNNYCDLKFVEGSQEVGLKYTNQYGGKNDEQLKKMFDYYPELLRKLDKSNFDDGEVTFIQNIFSIKKNRKKTKKIIRILGLKFKIKN